MDGWMQMAAGLREAAMKRAEEMAAKDSHISKADMRRIVFASMQELNATLAQTELAEFLTVLAHATTDKYNGYGLPEVARDCGVSLVRKRYPLDIGALLPWWNKLGKPEDLPGN
jgi:ribosomal protein S12 methylthiotransferase accessory factor YcaO